MTPIRAVSVLDTHTTTTRTLTAAAMGCAIGFAAAITCLQYVEHPAQTEADRIMESACRLGPEIGAYAWQHRKPEGVECGRYR